MTQVDFYVLPKDGGLTVAQAVGRITEKALGEGHQVFIQTTDEAEAINVEDDYSSESISETGTLLISWNLMATKKARFLRRRAFGSHQSEIRIMRRSTSRTHGGEDAAEAAEPPRI